MAPTVAVIEIEDLRCLKVSVDHVAQVVGPSPRKLLTHLRTLRSHLGSSWRMLSMSRGRESFQSGFASSPLCLSAVFIFLTAS